MNNSQSVFILNLLSAGRVVAPSILATLGKCLEVPRSGCLHSRPSPFGVRISRRKMQQVKLSMPWPMTLRRVEMHQMDIALRSGPVPWDLVAVTKPSCADVPLSWLSSVIASRPALSATSCLACGRCVVWNCLCLYDLLPYGVRVEQSRSMHRALKPGLVMRRQMALNLHGYGRSRSRELLSSTVAATQESGSPPRCSYEMYSCRRRCA